MRWEIVRLRYGSGNKYNLMHTFLMQVSSGCFSILSNKPSGVYGVDTITIKGSDFAMYLSETCRTSSCSPLRKKSASSNKMNL
jgi:hypothetical protein